MINTDSKTTTTSIQKISVVLLGITLGWYCAETPYINADIVAYTMSVFGIENQDPNYLHREGYAEVRKVATDEQWNYIVAANDKRKISASAEYGPKLVGEWRSKFMPRLAYIMPAYVLWKCGMNAALATCFVSAVCMGFCVWPMWILAGKGWRGLLGVAAIIFFWNMAYVGQKSTPGSMACLLCLWSLVLALRRSKWLLVLVVLAPLVRPDLIIFSGLILWWAGGKPEWKVAAGMLALLIAFGVSHLFGTPPWSASYYNYACVPALGLPFAFMQRDAPAVTWDMYWLALYARSPLLWMVHHTIMYWLITILALLIAKRDRLLLLGVPMAYFIIHFMVFPFIVPRFFIWVYISGALVLLRESQCCLDKK